jgi:colanic acid/amylovoran biosynthesis glycosyltransferase
MTRILFVLDKFPCYSETFVFDQIIGLIDRGFAVNILAFNRDPSAIPADIEQKYQLRERCCYLLDEQKSTAPRDKLWSRFLLISKNLGRGKVWAAFNKNRFGPFTKNGFLAAVVAKNNTIFLSDIVLCHFGTTAHLADCLQQLGLLSGAIIPVFHGYDLSEAQVLSTHLPGYQRLFMQSPKILAISNLWCQKLKQLGCPPEKIILHRMGVALAHFQFQQDSRPLQQPLRLLSVARFTEKKGLQYAISAVALLRQQGIPVHYQIIGDGPLRPLLEQQINALGLTDIVQLRGIQPAKMVATALADSDVFVLPSVTAANGDMEGVPVSLMEAMASGTLCLSTVHSGIPELIEHGRTGLLVPERDADALAAQLIKLQQQLYPVAQIRQQARLKIETEFNQQHLYDQLAQLCQEFHHGEH